MKYELPQLKEILDETYGVILYQEQVMRIANKLANFSLGQADILRKAMGKKKAEVMAKQKEHFVNGAKSNGISEKKAVRIFDLMELFAEYGFNKSHSAAYAYVSFQTAYLKAHYPVEFMAATLSTDMNDTDKIVKSITECRKMKVEMLPPDINLSGREFTVIRNSIRFGLEAVKGVGAAAIESIIEVRTEGGPFLSVSDFIERVDTRKVNKKVLESLVKAGSFDSLGVTRAAAMKTVSDALNGSRMKNPGQTNIFGDEMPEAEVTEEWEEAELLKNEKEALGFYITGHPLAKHEKMLARLGARKTSDLENAADREEVMVGGILRALKKKNVKSTGDMMAYVTLEDNEGSVEVIVFPDLYRKTNGLLSKDEAVLVKGDIDKDEKGVRVRAREITGLEEAGRRSYRNMELSLEGRESCSGKFPGIREVVDRYPGDLPFYLRIRLDGIETIIATACRVRPDRVLVGTLEDVAGKGAVTVS